ncbi:ABC transporter permease [Polaromonas sp. P2-4]|nr:ABC transporter permease [Polaromonas sp. P2-4]
MPALLLLTLVYFYPLFQVLAVSFIEPTPGLGNYARLLNDPDKQRVFLTTFRISAITTLVSVLVSYAVSFIMVHSSGRRLKLVLVCVMVPFWISVLVRAFAWMVLLRTTGVINTLLQALGIISEPLDLIYNEFGVVVGMVHYMVPVATLTLYGQMKGIDKRLMAAARGLGAGGFYSFRRIFLPLSIPGIAAAAILIFISALGFFIIPVLLGGGKTLMLAEYISMLILQTTNWGLGTAMASVLVVLTFLLIFILSRVVDLRRVFGGV